jgi:hypothetical protein
MRRVGRQELEGERAEATPPGHLDRLELRASDPERRVRFLERLRQDVAQRHVEILAVMLDPTLAEHRDDGADRLFPDRPLLVERDAEGLQLGDAGALAGAEFDPAVRDEVERGDALGAARRMRRRQLHDAVREADLLRALRGGGEEHFGGRRVRILFEEMVLDLPGVVVAEPVGQFDLVERVLIELQFAARQPRPRQLQLVEDPEFHRSSFPFVIPAPAGIQGRQTRRSPWTPAFAGTTPPKSAPDDAGGPLALQCR